MKILAIWIGLTMAGPLNAADYVWNGVRRIVAVGDIHGDYDRYIAVLQSAGLINKKLDWTGDKTHMVQLGDVMDRGSSSRKIMDLLMKLEKQAEQAKGKVHVLIGNHEVINVAGSLSFVSKEEFLEFSSPQSSDIRQSFYNQEVEAKKKQAEAEGLSFSIDEAWKTKWESQHPIGWVEHRAAYGPEGTYGQWIRSHNAIIKINDTLFLHAGIGPNYVGMPADEINDRIRREMQDLSLIKGGISLDAEGPLVYRGLARGDEQELSEHVKTVLNRFGVKRIVIGHTPTITTVIPRFGGAVIQADVGLSKFYGGPPSCVIIERGKPYALHRGKKLAIPTGGDEKLLEYLKKAAALDPKPSPIEKVIIELQQKLNQKVKAAASARIPYGLFSVYRPAFDTN